jgi:hypothetical protein
MKINLTVDLSAQSIADLADQLPQAEFSRAKKLIDAQARLRFGQAVSAARREYKRSGLKRKDVIDALAEVRSGRK